MLFTCDPPRLRAVRIITDTQGMEAMSDIAKLSSGFLSLLYIVIVYLFDNQLSFYCLFVYFICMTINTLLLYEPDMFNLLVSSSHKHPSPRGRSSGAGCLTRGYSSRALSRP